MENATTNNNATTNEEPTVVVGVRMKKELRDRLEEESEREHRSLSGHLNYIIEKHFTAEPIHE